MKLIIIFVPNLPELDVREHRRYIGEWRREHSLDQISNIILNVRTGQPSTKPPIRILNGHHETSVARVFERKGRHHRHCSTQE